mmetsp:Transcript_9862/g.24127  ORF Transcript_9862/g.24127 Transcript_9862/m.24127 type:complete len:233 (-) Transcript_9862:710-1408(-)
MTFGTLLSELAFETLWSWLRMLLSLSVSFVSLTVSLALNVTTGYVPPLELNASIDIISLRETRLLWDDSSSDSNCSWVSSSPLLDASASLLNDSSLLLLYLDTSSLLLDDSSLLLDDSSLLLDASSSSLSYVVSDSECVLLLSSTDSSSDLRSSLLRSLLRFRCCFCSHSISYLASSMSLICPARSIISSGSLNALPPISIHLSLALGLRFLGMIRFAISFGLKLSASSARY